MIPYYHIQEWAKTIPWKEVNQVEQDLIISNALLKIYSSNELRECIAFRGGTALNKLFFNPPSRYSEDIDLVQIKDIPSGPIVSLIREVLDSWLGEPQRRFSEGRIKLIYRNISENGMPLKLKIEINNQEHYTHLGFTEHPFSIQSSWAQGKVLIRSYKLEELLGTKIRALYQRKKGRDLYDLDKALRLFGNLNLEDTIGCFKKYTNASGVYISQSMFKQNLELKLKDREFREDITPLLPKNVLNYDPDEAFKLVFDKLISKI